jgi:hypothetical protein
MHRVTDTVVTSPRITLKKMKKAPIQPPAQSVEEMKELPRRPKSSASRAYVADTAHHLSARAKAMAIVVAKELAAAKQQEDEDKAAEQAYEEAERLERLAILAAREAEKIARIEKFTRDGFVPVLVKMGKNMVEKKFIFLTLEAWEAKRVTCSALAKVVATGTNVKGVDVVGRFLTAFKDIEKCAAFDVRAHGCPLKRVIAISRSKIDRDEGSDTESSDSDDDDRVGIRRQHRARRINLRDVKIGRHYYLRCIEEPYTALQPSA